jgi:starvation-inducible DNA-binding protein
MLASPSRLSEAARAAVVAALDACVIDGVDLYTQIKVAHWNVRGPLFVTVHELLDEIATHVGDHVDELAERAVTLGGRVAGTARQVAHGTRIDELPATARRDLELVRAIADRTEQLLDGLRAARAIASRHEDADTEDLLTGAIRGLEKDGWFLRATLDA